MPWFVATPPLRVSYPEIGEPLSAGAVHEIVTDDGVEPEHVGGAGTDGEPSEVEHVCSLDHGEVPIPFVARTANWNGVSDGRPVNVSNSAVPTLAMAPDGVMRVS